MNHFFKLLSTALFASILFYSTPSQAQFARGADIGWLSEMEQSGRVFKDSLGVQRDLLDILDDYCVNSIRLRVWVNPTGGWCGKQDVINVAKRAAAKGYRLMIDFHYSDSWADPGQQTKPAAWASYNITQLRQAVYDHTYDVLSGLKTAGVTPDWVQVGNETNDGMLWPEGRASVSASNMANYASFVTRGYDAVKAVFPNTKVVAHVANGYDNALFRWNIGGLVSNGAKFDVIAMSFYPTTPADWQTYSQQALTNMQDMVSRYGKDVMVSEIGVSVSAPSEARQFVERSIQNLQSLPNNRGLGIFWWEPQAYDWRGYDKVAWNYSTQRPTEAMKGFRVTGCSKPIPVKKDSVNVTFRLTATGVNTTNGMYMTGAFSGTPNWSIVPMTSQGGNVFAYTKRMAVGDSGAYYYLNANAWTERETVPSACATWYTTDRGYKIKAGSHTIQDIWSSCGTITGTDDNALFYETSIFPNPFSEKLHIVCTGTFEVEIRNLSGQLIVKESGNKELHLPTDCPSGLYVVLVSQHDGVRKSWLMGKE
jgi:arabinogalactan endo-1,4-beta-galactosidase